MFNGVPLTFVSGVTLGVRVVAGFVLLTIWLRCFGVLRKGMCNVQTDSVGGACV